MFLCVNNMQPLDYSTVDFKGMDSLPLPSSSRVMRNLAEKQRRDKLNSYISELAALVPSVASAARKLDKTSILRLSANFLRLHQNLDVNSSFDSRQAITQKRTDVAHMILQSLNAFLLVISTSGKIVYISEGVEKALGHAQADMMGLPIYCFVHPEDHVVVKKQLAGYFQEMGSRGGRCGRCTMEVRLAGRSMGRGEPVNYERVHITGKFRLPAPRRRKFSNSSPDKDPPDPCTESELNQSGVGCPSPSTSRPVATESLLVAVARLIPSKTLASPLTILESMQDEYITRHLADGTITQTDHRISVVAGYFPEEVVGKQAFAYIFVDELPFSVAAQRIMLNNPQKEGFVTHRIVTRTGKLIYMRSRGFLELDPVTQQVIGFVCINSLIDEEQGEKETREIKEMILSLNINVQDSPSLGLETKPSSSPTTLLNSLHLQPPSLLPALDTSAYTEPELPNGSHAVALSSTSAIPPTLLAPVAMVETNVISTYVHRASMTGGKTSTRDAYGVLQPGQMSHSATAGYPSSFPFKQPFQSDSKFSKDGHSSDSNDSFCSDCTECVKFRSTCPEQKNETNAHIPHRLGTSVTASLTSDLCLTSPASCFSAQDEAFASLLTTHLVPQSGESEHEVQTLSPSTLNYDSAGNTTGPGPMYGCAKRKKYLPYANLRPMPNLCDDEDSWAAVKDSNKEATFIHTLLSQRQTCVYRSDLNPGTLVNSRTENA